MAAQTEQYATSEGISLRFGWRTDVGYKRLENEDSVLAAPGVFIVADGMGGLEAGQQASRAVIAQFQAAPRETPAVVAEVVAAVDRAHTHVRALSESTKRGAGSTLTGLVLIDHEHAPHWCVINVGDSRVYSRHNGELRQLTVDHSLAQERIDNGTLLPEQVASFIRKNVITRAMGADNSSADYWLRPVVSGERFLVCSDGLSNELSNETIQAALVNGGTSQHTADMLLNSALERGGRDNISVIVIDVLAGGVASWQGSVEDAADQTENDDTRTVASGAS